MLAVLHISLPTTYPLSITLYISPSLYPSFPFSLHLSFPPISLARFLTINLSLSLAHIISLFIYIVGQSICNAQAAIKQSIELQ